MAIQGLNTTNYSGEVLENVLTLATTGNELVSRGLIMVIPGVNSESAFRALRRERCCKNERKTRRKLTARGTLLTVKRN